MKKLRQVLEQVKVEREHRVMLSELPPECASMIPVAIRQAFIRECRRDGMPFCDVRIRSENGTRYTLTAKYRPEYQEATTDITEDMFNVLWPRSFGKQEKDRYKLQTGWTVDDVRESRSGRFVVAEYEMAAGEVEPMIPESFKVLKRR